MRDIPHKRGPDARAPAPPKPLAKLDSPHLCKAPPESVAPLDSSTRFRRFGSGARDTPDLENPDGRDSIERFYFDPKELHRHPAGPGACLRGLPITNDGVRRACLKPQFCCKPPCAKRTGHPPASEESGRFEFLFPKLCWSLRSCQAIQRNSVPPASPSSEIRQ